MLYSFFFLLFLFTFRWNVSIRILVTNLAGCVRFRLVIFMSVMLKL
jgi:hypothetical protein